MYMHTYTQTNICIYTHIYTCTYTRIHAQTYTYACICSPMHRLKISVSTPQRVKQYHRRICVCIYICMHMHIYMHIHCGTTCSECVRRCVCWCHKNTCVTYTPAHALVPKTPVLKCTQHSLQKIAHIYIHTHICTRIHMCINAYVHIYVHTCIYIHIYMSTHKHTYTYIHNHTNCTYESTQAHLERQRDCERARSRCTAGSFTCLFRSTQSNHISHLKYKDFHVWTFWKHNKPPSLIPSSQNTQE